MKPILLSLSLFGACLLSSCESVDEGSVTTTTEETIVRQPETATVYTTPSGATQETIVRRYPTEGLVQTQTTTY